VCLRRTGLTKKTDFDCSDGYVTSDCDADADVFNTHSYLNHSRSQVVADILHAGTDVDCGTFITGAAKKENRNLQPVFPQLS